MSIVDDYRRQFGWRSWSTVLDAAPLDVDAPMDGLWCSFAAAYLPDPIATLAAWRTLLRRGAWIALTEIDDLFGHEPLDTRARALLDDYARDARSAGRYDFHRGRRLGELLGEAGFAVQTTLILEDRELSFEGPAQPEVVVAWRARFDRMRLLQEFCGAEFVSVRDAFLDTLTRPEHRSDATVYSSIATA